MAKITLGLLDTVLSLALKGVRHGDAKALKDGNAFNITVTLEDGKAYAVTVKAKG